VESELDSEFINGLRREGLLTIEEAKCLVNIALKAEAPWVRATAAGGGGGGGGWCRFRGRGYGCVNESLAATTHTLEWL
jgi:hypothetical protein